MLGRLVFRRCLLTVAVVCLILFFLPSDESVQKGRNRKTTIQLGVPFSQWFHFENEHIETAEGTVSEKSSWGIDVLSWSSVVAVIGLSAHWSARRLRPPDHEIRPPVDVQANRPDDESET